MVKKTEKKDHLSYSALGKFDRCPRSYYEEFTGNWKDDSSTKALLAGQLFHKYIEVRGAEDLLNSWVSLHPNSTEFFMKSKPGTMYADFHKVMNSAQDFIDLELYPEIPSDAQVASAMKAGIEGKEVVEADKGFYIQEVRLEGDVSNVPFVGVIDLLTIKDGEIYIRDWKHIKDFRKVYDEAEGRYLQWYEKYIKQQMLYAYLLYHGQAKIIEKEEKVDLQLPELKENMPIHCEIVGITKGYEIAVKRIKFDFDDIKAMVDTDTWNLLASNVRYTWNKLQKVTPSNKKSLRACGECLWCKEHGIVIDEYIEID